MVQVILLRFIESVKEVLTFFIWSRCEWNVFGFCANTFIFWIKKSARIAFNGLFGMDCSGGAERFNRLSIKLKGLFAYWGFGGNKGLSKHD